MAKIYYVNNDATRNPGYHHEVHTSEHVAQLGIRNTTRLGLYNDEIAAVAAAKVYYYSDADGCKICCPKAHKG